MMFMSQWHGTTTQRPLAKLCRSSRGRYRGQQARSDPLSRHRGHGELVLPSALESGTVHKSMSVLPYSLMNDFDTLMYARPCL